MEPNDISRAEGGKLLTRKPRGQRGLPESVIVENRMVKDDEEDTKNNKDDGISKDELDKDKKDTNEEDKKDKNKKDGLEEEEEEEVDVRFVFAETNIFKKNIFG
jgi:hypothetical protein